MTENINAAFVFLLKDKELRDITVTDICKLADIDRSIFYAHYDDVSVLADAYAAQIEKQVSEHPYKEGDFS